MKKKKKHLIIGLLDKIDYVYTFQINIYSIYDTGPSVAEVMEQNLFKIYDLDQTFEELKELCKKENCFDPQNKKLDAIDPEASKLTAEHGYLIIENSGATPEEFAPRNLNYDTRRPDIWCTDKDPKNIFGE